MAIIINPQQPSAGYLFGSGLGQALGQGLQDLAQEKLMQLKASQQQAGISKTLQGLGLSPQDAQLFSMLPESTRYNAALDYLKSSKQAPAQAEMQMTQEKPTFGIQQQESLNDLFKEFGRGILTPDQQKQRIAEVLGQPSFKPQVQQPQQPVVQNIVPPQPTPIAQAQVPIQQQAQQPASALEYLTARPELFQQPTFAPMPGEKPETALKRQLAERKEKAEAEKESKKEQHRIDKETLPFYEEQLKADKSAKDNDKRLNRMLHLVEKGSLPIAAFYKLFKDLDEVSAPGAALAGGAIGSLAGAGPIGGAIGATIGGLIKPVASLLRSAQKFTSPDTEEYEKLTTDFIRDAKNIFGSRITDADLAAFMQMIPSLSVTDAGKKQIIQNMKAFNEAVHIRTEAMKDIIKENAGRRPENLPILVEERSGKSLDKLTDDFVAGIKPLK